MISYVKCEYVVVSMGGGLVRSDIVHVTRSTLIKIAA